MNTTVECRECGRTVPDSVELCLSCMDEFADELRSVPGIVADISITAARLDRMSNSRNGGKSAETALPIRLDKQDKSPTQSAYDTLTTTITTWGQLLERHYRQTIPLGARGLLQLVLNNRASTRVDPTSVSLTPCTEAEQVALWISCNPHTVRALPASHELIKEVTNAIARARLAIDRLPELRYLGPCPSRMGEDRNGDPRICGFELRAERGEEWVRCRRCREQHEIKKLLRDARKRIEDRLCTMVQIREYLTAMGYLVPSQTLHTWNYRGRLPKRGWLHGQTITTAWIHRDDPPVFRLGDVLRLVERNQAEDAKKVGVQ